MSEVAFPASHWIHTPDLATTDSHFTHAGAALSEDEVLRTYCGLDSCITVEVHRRIEHLPPAAAHIYAWERALRAPLMQMMLRGILVDIAARQEAVLILEKTLGNLHGVVNRLAQPLWGRRLDPNSPQVLAQFFYRAMACEPIWAIHQGDRHLTTGKLAMEKLHSRYPILRPIIDCIGLAKRYQKLASVMKTGVGRDGRMRTSFNPTTETGRLSSSRAPDGSGSNLQNLEELIRRVFIADPGKKLAYIDKKSAESVCTGYISGDEGYIAACFDPVGIHTVVARMVWQDDPWPGDRAAWRAYAEATMLGGKSKYDLAKRLGHLSNYGGEEQTAARVVKVAPELALAFRQGYFGAFPGIPAYHHWCAETLVRDGEITTPFGRTRQFFGRLRDPSTLREAIANTPQSMTADDLNRGMYWVWERFDAVRRRLRCDLLLQVHDAVLIQYDEAIEAEILPAVMDTLVMPTAVTSPVDGKTRTMRIPVDCAVGWNWAKEDPKRKRFADGNPDGLRSWSLSEPDRRKRSRSASATWEGFRLSV